MRAILRGWTHLAPEVRDFEFQAETDRLDYTPGQFVSFSAEIGGKRITRAYSIASAPNGNRFHLCLNRVNGGLMSPWLFDLPEGGAVDMQGPLGTFVIRDPARELFLAATGTGVAPFRAMIEAHLPVATAPVTLVLGVRFEENLLYRAEFEAWRARWPLFRFVPVLSRGGEDWRGRRGHIQQHLIELIGAGRDAHVYACGMKAMTDDVRARLKALGFDRRQIVVEKYD